MSKSGPLVAELVEALRGEVPRLAVAPDEAAQALGVSRTFFDENIAHELKWVRRGRRKFVSLRELERWLADAAAYAIGDGP